MHFVCFLGQSSCCCIALYVNGFLEKQWCCFSWCFISLGINHASAFRFTEIKSTSKLTSTLDICYNVSSLQSIILMSYIPSKVGR